MKNKGLNTESFNVTAFYNNSAIGTQTVSNLAASNTITLNFTWDTLEITPGNYTIKAQADSLPNEYNTTDNTLSCKGIVHIKILGDVNSDDKVDVQDLREIGKAFGSAPTSTNWNPECDFNRDKNVDASDLFDLSKNYGKTC